MSFYFRKSIKVGPLRFNLSGSGVGVSAGIRGLRFGLGPRGNYVHMGRSGIYYRATIPPSSRDAQGRPPRPAMPEIPVGTHDPLQEIDSANVAQIVDSSSIDLLNELNEKQRKHRVWPWALIGSILLLLIGLSSGWSSWLILLLLLSSAIAVYALFYRDLLGKTAVLFYNFEPEMESAYGLLHKAAEELASCARAWHIEAEGRVHDRKYHAGASSLVRRKPTYIGKAQPPYVKTNIETIAIGVGRQTLHFFPDRVLVYDTSGVGAVGYQQLELGMSPSRFIEDQGVPRDAQVVDHTWKYVNKKGGPDRRFKDNRQLPICLYDELTLRSATGLNEVIQVSRSGVASGFITAVGQLAAALPPESSQPIAAAGGVAG